MIDMTHTHTLIPGKHHLSPFWRHFLQMLAVMMIGMIAGGAVLLTVVGVKTWEEVTTQYGSQALVVMAVGMTVPMVAWMLYRGMGWKNSYEMAAVMVIPMIPFLCLYWFGVTKSAQCGGYCAVTILAMLALMFYRRPEYSSSM
jgi:cytochrome bd-type quinol oxidase subunit 2